jgi:hypothetical protein
MLGYDPRSLSYVGPPGELGLAAPTNVSIAASVSNNLLTVMLGQRAPSRPMWFPFRHPTATAGELVWRQALSPLIINTVATGATLATASSNAPFRIWIVVFDAGDGRVVPALWQSVTGGATPTAIAGLDEDAVQSTTAISGSATAAGTFYTPSGITLTSKPFRIVGYLEYSAGLATAGTYASAPTKLQLFGPGIKKPGDVVQTKLATSTSGTSVNNTTPVQTPLTCSITPRNAANLVGIDVRGAMSTGQNSGYIQANISRGTGPTNIGSSQVAANQVAGYVDSSSTLYALDAPGVTTSVAYYVYIVASGALGVAAEWNRLGATTIMTATELMT